jgi:dihydrodipicolinate synthase/N-acetylneuraminate lyase
MNRYDSAARPIIVAPTPTPFTEDGGLDLAALEGNIRRWLNTSLSGFVLNTENGEESFLSDSERVELIRVVAEHRDDRLLLAGIDHPSARETLRRADEYAELGADMIRLRIPRLTPRRDEYFSEVLPRMPVPVMLIHQMAPGMFLAHGTAPAAWPERIGDWTSMPNVAGYIASADMRFETRVRRFVDSDRQFWTANGSLILSGALMGANGACMMLANVFPNQARQIFERVAEGDLKSAQETQSSLFDADWEILSRQAAGLKAALASLGFDLGGPRAPQAPCNEEEVEAIRRCVAAVV